MTQPGVILTILAPKQIENRLIDAVLDHGPIAASGFTSREVNGHGSAAVYRSVAEQVRARTRLVEITIATTEANADSLIAQIADALPGQLITYYLCPLIRAGVIA